eukprot:139696_1
MAIAYNHHQSSRRRRRTTTKFSTCGFITGTGSLNAITSSTISIQWDTGLYQCNVQPNSADTPFECIVSNPVHCPAMTDFWMSVYNPSSGGDILHVKAIWFEDETTAKYTFSEEFI